MTIPIVTFRSSGFTDYQFSQIKEHPWFWHEHKKTISFKPTAYMTEAKAKKIIKSFLTQVKLLTVGR